MENVNIPVNDVGDVSSEGEEDFESADEGEGKEKAGAKCEDLSSNDNIVVTNSGETRKIMTETISEGIQDTSGHGASSGKTVGGETGSLTDTERRSQSMLDEQSLDSDIGTSGNKIDISKGRGTGEEKETTDEQNESDQKSTQLKELSSAGTQPKNSSSAGTQQNESSSAAVSGGWGWGSWSTVLNQATNTMTSGLSQVIEKVETTLGIPEPGELEDEAFSKDQKKEVITMEPTPAEIDRNVDESNNIAGTDSKGSESFFSSWGLTSLSSAVTSKGIELVTEGIGALETIGKKTMDVISEGDPGFRVKRDMFKKPSLSQILREAKEESAKQAVEKKTQEVLEKVNFNDEFDRFQGLAHLEALEILSRECEAKIESALIDVFEDDLEQAKAKLRAVEDAFGKTSPNEEDHEESMNTEFAEEIGKCAMALNLAFVPNKLNQTEESISKWLKECTKDQETSAHSRRPDDIFSHVITSLADITAKSVEVFRKVAEMILLVDDKDNTVTAEDRATHLCSITKVVTNRISSLSTSYAQCLNTAVNETEDDDNITPLITEVYLECSNSSSHVQDAYKLLLPVLQVSALNSLKT